ncbi:MAG: carboxypeptidase regulatory-like domain-containing protein [Kofleriaceae bacterium]|jgi:hypothetical protein|nr:carboxypeptidase regulatory-like domain-containing protein [Kofleriaceae bacterium]
MPSPRPSPRTRPTRRRLLVAAALGLTVLGGWWWSRGDDAARPRGDDRPTRRAQLPQAARQQLDALRRLPGLAWRGGGTVDLDVPAGMLRVAGHVQDRKGGGVAEVEVVFAGDAGEASVVTDASGAYALAVSAGDYRVFVRSDDVISVGAGEADRLPGLPDAMVSGVPDVALATRLAIAADRDHVDLQVEPAGRVRGRVIDRQGRPIAGAVVRAMSGGPRPVLGTDVGESDGDGQFELRVPAGLYALDATHDRYAGTTERAELMVEAKQVASAELTLVGGCILTGRVVARGGQPAGDGAIERHWGHGAVTDQARFAPAGRIESDGSFRWVTTEEEEVTLRAWPWKSPPSPAKTFACREGARFDNIVFELGSMAPDVDGTIRNADGSPAAFAFIDLGALSEGGIGQQERADADGRWNVYNMPAGEYEVTVSTEDGGIVTRTIQVPARGVDLTLSGSGSIEGTAVGVEGSLTARLTGCAHRGRGRTELVEVRGGRFRIDRVSACEQTVFFEAGGRRVHQYVEVAAGQVARVELDLTPLREKTVVGVVLAGDGTPVAGAAVGAISDDGEGETEYVSTDSRGRFELRTTGSTVVANLDGAFGATRLGAADVDREEVTIHLEREHFDDIDQPSEPDEVIE